MNAITQYKIVTVPFEQEGHVAAMTQLMNDELANGWHVVSTYAIPYAVDHAGFSLEEREVNVVFGRVV